LNLKPEGKNEKAKQTIMHCTTKQYKTRNEMKRNALIRRASFSGWRTRDGEVWGGG